MEEESSAKDDVSEKEQSAADKLDQETKEKLIFNLVTCYLEKDSFEKVFRYAKMLKGSENSYYSYYGRYLEALSARRMSRMSAKRMGIDADKVKKLYGSAIAYFRRRIVENHTDAMASVFRARLYAEQGEYEKAKWVAGMLSEEDRNSVVTYIEQLQEK